MFSFFTINEKIAKHQSRLSREEIFPEFLSNGYDTVLDVMRGE